MNAEYIAKKLEAITVIQNGETTKPLQEFADFVRQQQAEIEALRWKVNHREQDVDALKTKLNDVKYKYDIKTHQHIYTQVYVDELQAEIEALKAKKLNDLYVDGEIAGWLGYHEGHLVSFLQTQEQMESFLTNTDTAGQVRPVYTTPRIKQ